MIVEKHEHHWVCSVGYLALSWERATSIVENHSDTASTGIATPTPRPSGAGGGRESLPSRPTATPVPISPTSTPTAAPAPSVGRALGLRALDLIDEYQVIVGAMPDWDSTPSIESAHAWICRLKVWLGGPYSGDVDGGVNGWLKALQDAYGNAVPDSMKTTYSLLIQYYDLAEQGPGLVGDYIVRQGGNRSMPCT